MGISNKLKEEQLFIYISRLVSGFKQINKSRDYTTKKAKNLNNYWLLKLLY